jgi:hypothetical protein
VSRGTGLAPGSTRPGTGRAPFEEDDMLRSVLVQATLATVLAFALGAREARAQEEARGFSLDLFGSSITAKSGGDTADEETWGMRGSYRFTNAWALEGSLSTLRFEGVDLFFGDFSAKGYVLHSHGVDVYLLSGVGLLTVEDLNFPEATLHAGVGAEIALGERGAYLRPEIRARWPVQDVSAVTFLDYSVGIGWRF